MYVLDVLSVAKILVGTGLLTIFLSACEPFAGDGEEPPDLPGVPRVSLVVERLHGEYAANSLVFNQDRVSQQVVGLGRVDQVLLDGTAIFQKDAGSRLLCASESSADYGFLEGDMWVLLRGRVAGLADGVVRLEHCEFREFHWASG